MMCELQIYRELFEVGIIAPYFYIFLTQPWRGARSVVMGNGKTTAEAGLEVADCHFFARFRDFFSFFRRLYENKLLPLYRQ